MSYAKSHCGVTTVVTITSHDLSWFQWIVLDRFQCGESCALSTYTTDFFAELVNFVCDSSQIRTLTWSYVKVICHLTCCFIFSRYYCYCTILRCYLCTCSLQLIKVNCICTSFGRCYINDSITTHVDITTSDGNCSWICRSRWIVV